MKKRYFVLFVLLFLAIIIFPKIGYAETFSEGGYTIQDYDIDMVVNENNTFDITEKLTVDFSEARHRDI